MSSNTSSSTSTGGSSSDIEEIGVMCEGSAAKIQIPLPPKVIDLMSHIKEQLQGVHATTGHRPAGIVLVRQDKEPEVINISTDEDKVHYICFFVYHVTSKTYLYLPLMEYKTQNLIIILGKM